MTKRRVQPGFSKVGVAYLRCSTDRQRLDAQRDAINAWATAQGVRVVAWFEDFGISGSTPPAERPGLQDALAAVKQHRAGLLVAAKRDRFSREAVEAALLARDTVHLGARLVTADGSSGDELIAGILDLVAEHEVRTIRSRVTAALAAKRSRGEKLGGAAPYGWRAVHRDGAAPTLEPDPDEAAVIAIARQLRDQHGWSMRDIARELTELGKVSRAGRPFNLTQVARMLARSSAESAHQPAPFNAGGP